MSLPSLLPVTGSPAVSDFCFVAGSVDSCASAPGRPGAAEASQVRCAANGCKGVLMSCCLVLSCVFRVSMLDGSLCFELCLQPVVCAAAHDLTLVG